MVRAAAASSFDHHGMLFCGTRHLHAARSTNTRMGNISITGDFIGRIYDHYAFIGFIRQDAGYFTQQSGFTHTWATKYQDRLTLFDNITNEGNTAEYRSTNTAGQADYFSFTIT
jgi:hypothetical protein